MYINVLFDLFGTLIPAPQMTHYRQMVADVAEILEQQYEPFYEQWMSINDGRLDGSFGCSEGDILAAAELVGAAVSDSQMAACMDVRRTITRYFMMPKSGTLHMLSELRDTGCQIGLVTDCVFDVPAVWPETELAPYFSAMQFSCESKIRKPDAQAYLSVIDRLNSSVEETLFVGDGGSDELNGAIRCGIDALKIDDTESPEHEMLRVGVGDWNGPVVKNISDIIDYVRRGRGS